MVKYAIICSAYTSPLTKIMSRANRQGPEPVFSTYKPPYTDQINQGYKDYALLSMAKVNEKHSIKIYYFIVF